MEKKTQGRKRPGGDWWRGQKEMAGRVERQAEKLLKIIKKKFREW